MARGVGPRAVFSAGLSALAVLALPPASPSASTMAVQPDGKIVVAGSASQGTPYCIGHHCSRRRVMRPAAARLDANGHPDPDFGIGGGIVDFRGGGFSSVAVLPGRGILLGSEYGSRFRIAALDGRGDPAFGFGREGVTSGPPATADSASLTTILPQPDGSLVVGGNLGTYTPKSLVTSSSVAIAMGFSASGVPGERLGEVSLGPGHLVQLADLIPEGDGFIAVGSVTDPGAGPAGAYLARFSDSVFPYDPSFGGGVGLIRSGPFADSGYNVAFNSAVANDGRLIAVGRRGGRILLARYNVDGTLDQSFGEGGMVVVALPGGLASLPGEYVSAEARSVTVQPDGRYVVAGSARVAGGADVCDIKSSYCEYAFLARFKPDGSVDTSFGEGGSVVGRRVHGRLELALQPSGKILLSDFSLHVARYDAGGSLDTSFGEGGEAGVLPCQGTIAQRRRSGCLSTAGARLHTHGLSHGKPMSQFAVRASNALDPIAAVKLLLPPELEGGKGTAGNVRVVTVPRTHARIRVRPRVVSVSRLANARGIHVGIRAGVLRRVEPVATDQKLLFRIEVKFKDGTSQLFRFPSSD